MYKKNNIFVLPEMKASEMILSNPHLMLMMENFGINLSVREKTIKTLCEENNISIDIFISFANLFNGHFTHIKHQYSFEDIETIIQYLKKSHQYYLEEKYPKIQDCVKRMFEVNDHPQMTMVEKFFNDYYNEVREHLEYENSRVFPYVTSLYYKLNGKELFEIDVNYSVLDYKEHHDNIEEKLADLKNLLIKYLPVKNDQKIRRELLFGLFDLEYDLNIHSLIEDNILIPLVEQMEQHLKVVK